MCVVVVFFADQIVRHYFVCVLREGFVGKRF